MVSIFKFERSALRKLGRSFWSEDEDSRHASPRSQDLTEDQSDPYLSQSASFLTGQRILATPGDGNDAY